MNWTSASRHYVRSTSGQSQMLGFLLGWGAHVPYVRATGGNTRRQGLSTSFWKLSLLLVSGWSKHFSAMLASCSVLCCHGSKPIDWSFFSLSDFPKNGRLLSVFAVSVPSRGRNSVRIFWTRKLREEGQGKVKMWGQNLRSFLPLLLQRHHYQMN